MNRFETKDTAFKGNIGSALALDTKLLTETGEFEGYASIFGALDQGDDIVMPGAFTESLMKRPADKIKLLWQHQSDIVLGKFMEVREDSKGLYVKGKLFLNIQKAKEAHELMLEGAIDGLSIGYRTILSEYDRTTEVRRLTKMDLREISVVTFPMLESATVSLVKGDTLPTERELEKYLRDGGFSASQSKAIIANGFKSLKNMRDAGSGDEQGLKDALQQLAQSMRG